MLPGVNVSRLAVHTVYLLPVAVVIRQPGQEAPFCSSVPDQVTRFLRAATPAKLMVPTVAWSSQQFPLMSLGRALRGITNWFLGVTLALTRPRPGAMSLRAITCVAH